MAEIKRTEDVSSARTSQMQQRPEGEHQSGRRYQGGGNRQRYRKRVCRFCHNKDLPIDYKRVDIIVRCVSNKGKILPRRLTGNCSKHQRMVSRSIKKARMAGFMPFSVR